MIWFVLGLSGVGKTTFSEWLGSRPDWLHYEIDRWNVDGIRHYGLQAEWDQFYPHSAQARPLADEINRRITNASKEHAVVSFPSNIVLWPHLIAAGAKAGIRVIYLSGSSENCLEAFLERETRSGRNLSADHWQRFNLGPYQELAKPEYARYMVGVFTEAGAHKTCAEIFAELNKETKAYT